MMISWSKLKVYSRLTFSKRRKTKLEENKNNISGPLDFKIFWGEGGGACPQTPLESRFFSARMCVIFTP